MNLHTKSSATAEIVHVSGCYAVQGHSKSLTLVPIESWAHMRCMQLPISE